MDHKDLHSRRWNRPLARLVEGACAVLAIGSGASADTISGWGRAYDCQLTPSPAIPVVSAIAAGQNHTIAILPNGTVRCFGRNDFGQCNSPANLISPRSIDGGGEHSAAVRQDGTVVCWGSNAAGQCAIPTGLPAANIVACGRDFTAACLADGSVRAWGSNQYGQTAVPAKLTGIVDLDAGFFHCVALDSGGVVHAWGRNESGQLNIPATATGAVAVRAGGRSSAALRADQSSVQWGAFGGTYQGVTDVDFGVDFALLRKSDGRVQVVGGGTEGEGQIPPEIAGTTVSAIAAGGFHALVLSGVPTLNHCDCDRVGPTGETEVWVEEPSQGGKVDINSYCGYFWLGDDCGSYECVGQSFEGWIFYWELPITVQVWFEDESGNRTTCLAHVIQECTEGAYCTPCMVNCDGFAHVVEAGPNCTATMPEIRQCYKSYGNEVESCENWWIRQIPQIGATLSPGTHECVVYATNSNGGESPAYGTITVVAPDTDGDGIADCSDNCDTQSNPSQRDCDSDGVGDACEIAAGADDTDENGWPDACQTAFGDLNLDGRIDAADLAELMSRWDLAGQGDLDANGTVNAPDVALLLGRWGPLP
jgi:hypothetical protein